jgi:serine/threonine protein kinase
VNQKRSLSNHVISRWYRPPEIIFIEKDYDQAVDLWSLGCIVSDIVNSSEALLKQHPTSDVRQRCLFKGNSCFPLSPKKSGSDGSKSRVVSSGDQIIKILEILPALNSADKSFINDQSAIEYIDKLKLSSKQQKLDDIFKELVSGKLKEFNDLF